MISADLQYSPVLTQIAVGFQNAPLIADQIIPVIVVDAEAFQWMQFAASAAFDLYNNAANQDSEVPQVRSKGELVPGQTLDYALREPVNKLVENAAAQVGFAAKARVTTKLLGHMALAFEYRVMTALTTDSNFLASHILTPAIKWDQPTGTPIADCLEMIDLLPQVPGGRRIGIFSLPAWRALSIHASVLDAVKYTMVGGVVQTGPIAQLLGLDEIYVSRAQVHTGAPNAAEADLSLTYLMGDDVAFIIEPGGSTVNPDGTSAGGDKEQPAWAYTFRLRVDGQTMPVYTYLDEKRGGHGSTWVQVARNENTIVVGKIYGSRIKDTTT